MQKVHLYIVVYTHLLAHWKVTKKILLMPPSPQAVVIHIHYHLNMHC